MSAADELRAALDQAPEGLLVVVQKRDLCWLLEEYERQTALESMLRIGSGRARDGALVGRALDEVFAELAKRPISNEMNAAMMTVQELQGRRAQIVAEFEEQQ